MPLLQAVLFSSFWAFGLGQTKPKQLEISVTRARDKSAHIRCKVTIEAFGEEMIHWYRQKPDQSIEYLIYVSGTFNSGSLGGKNNKLEASKNLAAFTSTLKVNFLEKEDEAVYYCAFWTDRYYSSGWGKVFGQGTRLIVTPPDGRLDSDISPKPTIFLPSIAEINLHKAGTYLCLLEKFFPDAIRVHWKEKNGRTILESQQGNTVKTNDTYMKFSWLTVIKKSMDREYECVVTHENNKGGVDQEILFPSIKKVVSDIDSTEMCLKGTLQLQLANTSAYYTYLLLLLKSLVYFVVAAVCLLGRTADCGNAKSS